MVCSVLRLERRQTASNRVHIGTDCNGAVVRGEAAHMTSGWKVTVELSSVSESSTMKRCGFFLRMLSSPSAIVAIDVDAKFLES